MAKKKGFQMRIHIHHPISADDLYEMAIENPEDDVLSLIVGLDLAMQDWGFTEKLIAHFKALEIEMLKECGDYPVEPKKIKVD